MLTEEKKRLLTPAYRSTRWNEIDEKIGFWMREHLSQDAKVIVSTNARYNLINRLSHHFWIYHNFANMYPTNDLHASRFTPRAIHADFKTVDGDAFLHCGDVITETLFSLKWKYLFSICGLDDTDKRLLKFHCKFVSNTFRDFTKAPYEVWKRNDK